MKQKDMRLALSLFGKTVLAVVFCFLVTSAFNTFRTSGQTVVGYKYFSEKVEDESLFTALYDTQFLRYDYYHMDEDGKTFVLTGSYEYDYTTHRFEYSKELTEAVKKERPEFIPQNSTSQTTTSASGETTSTTTSTAITSYWQVVYSENESLNTLLSVVSQIVCLLLLASFVWTPIWKIGDKDSNAAEFSHKKVSGLRGLKIGVWSAVPFGVMVLGLFVSKLTGILPNFIVWYRVAAICFSPINTALTQGVTYTESMDPLMLLVAVLSWAFVPLVAWLAYTAGLRRWSVIDRLMYKKK